MYYEQRFGLRFLVDGQQRFVSLHLICIQLWRLLRELGEHHAEGRLTRVIRRKDGRKFSVGIEDHNRVLDAIIYGRTYEPEPGDSLSRRNLWEQSKLIEHLVRESIPTEALTYFTDWLLDRVPMVGIQAPDADSGYRIYETMNDRGARLTAVDLLKSHLLANVGTDEKQLNEHWRHMLSELTVDREDRTAASRFIKAVLFARYARRDRPQDQVEIERNLNSWVRANRTHLGLIGPLSYFRFVEDLLELARRLRPVLSACREVKQDCEVFYFNERNGLSAQLIAVLAALEPSDAPSEALEKALRVGRFLDRWYAMRVLDDLPVQPADVDEIVHGRLVPALRLCRSADEVTSALGDCLDEVSPADFGTFGLRPNNRPHVHYLLARATAFVDQACAQHVDVAAYLDSERYQIEHLWSAHHEQVRAEIENPLLFRSLRDRLGGLGLLPSHDNASLNAMPLADKRRHYARQNVLLGVLAPGYDMRNPRLRGFIKAHGLEAVLHPIGDKISMRELVESRQDLLLRLFTIIWDPRRLQITDREPPKADVESPPTGSTSPPVEDSAYVPAPPPTVRKKKGRGTDLARMVDAGIVTTGALLVLPYKGIDHWATVRADASVMLKATGDVFGSLDAAGCAVKGTKSCQGMRTWRMEIDGHRITLATLRDQAKERGPL